MLELMNQEQMFNVALGATVLVWVLIGGAYFKLVVGGRLAN